MLKQIFAIAMSFSCFFNAAEAEVGNTCDSSGNYIRFAKHEVYTPKRGQHKEEDYSDEIKKLDLKQYFWGAHNTNEKDLMTPDSLYQVIKRFPNVVALDLEGVMGAPGVLRELPKMTEQIEAVTFYSKAKIVEDIEHLFRKAPNLVFVECFYFKARRFKQVDFIAWCKANDSKERSVAEYFLNAEASKSDTGWLVEMFMRPDESFTMPNLEGSLYPVYNIRYKGLPSRKEVKIEAADTSTGLGWYIEPPKK